MANLADWAWPQDTYDAAVAIFIQFADPTLRAKIFASMQTATRASELILMQGNRPEQITYGTGGPTNPENLYSEQMLCEALSGWHIKHLCSHYSVIAEGAGHKGQSALIDLVARKSA